MGVSHDRPGTHTVQQATYDSHPVAVTASIAGTEARYVPSLTGLRCFAAAAIVLWHSQTGYFFPPDAFNPLLLSGAVSLFFVLSGFVLTINQTKYRSAADFLVARVARVWPAHLAAIVVLLLIFAPYSISLLRGWTNVSRLVLNVLLLQAWSPSIATYWSLNAPSWSISCELLFYLIFPWCVTWFGRAAGWWIVGLYAVTAVAVLAIAQAVPALDPNWLGFVNPLVNVPVFLLGIAAGQWFLTKAPAPANYRTATIIQCLAVAAALAGNMVFALLDRTGWPAAFLIYLRNSGPTPFYALLLIALARYDGAISRLLSLGAIVYLGEISYSIYLFHQLIIRWHSTHLAEFAAIPMWGQYAAIWVAIIATAALCHHYVERPGQRGLRAAWLAPRPGTRRLSRPARS
jgi:peptidoglycan/LPS O-acetylase OafA/YrhL